MAAIRYNSSHFNLILAFRRKSAYVRMLNGQMVTCFRNYMRIPLKTICTTMVAEFEPSELIWKPQNSESQMCESCRVLWTWVGCGFLDTSTDWYTERMYVCMLLFSFVLAWDSPNTDIDTINFELLLHPVYITDEQKPRFQGGWGRRCWNWQSSLPVLDDLFHWMIDCVCTIYSINGY